MTTATRTELLKILLIMVIALILLLFVQPGLLESPYNEF